MTGPNGTPIANTIADARAMAPEMRARRIAELRDEICRGVAGPAKRAMRVQRARVREIERLEKAGR